MRLPSSQRIRQWLSLPDHPLFNRELAKVRWVRDVRGMVRLPVFVALAMSVIVALTVALIAQAFHTQNSPMMWREALEAVGGVTYVVLLVSVGLQWLQNLDTITNSVGLLIAEKDANRLDLLRLGMSERALVQAKHAVGLARSWRTISLFLGIRLLAVAVGIIFLPMLTWEEAQNAFTWAQVAQDIGGLLFAAVGIAWLLAEPVWRARMYTALGVWMSARSNTRITALVQAIVASLMLAIVVGLVLWLAIYTAFLVIPPPAPGFVPGWRSAVAALVLLPLLAALAVAVTYIYYGSLQRFALRRTVRALQQHDPA